MYQAAQSGAAFDLSEKDSEDNGANDAELADADFENANDVVDDKHDEDLKYLPFEQVRKFVMSEHTFNTLLDKFEVFVNNVRSKQFVRVSPCPHCADDNINFITGTLHHCKRQGRWMCIFAGCNQDLKGFPDHISLKAHQRAVHKIGEHVYVCASSRCDKTTKAWLRLDNFRLHCQLTHKEEDVSELIVASTQATWNGDAPSEGAKMQCAPQSERNIGFVKYSWITLAKSHGRNFLDDVFRPLPMSGKERIAFHCVRSSMKPSETW